MNDSNLFQRTLENQSDRFYAIMRIGLGLLFAFHGMQKVLGLMTTHQPEVMSHLLIGGLIAGLCVPIGPFTRANACLASGTMASENREKGRNFTFNLRLRRN